MKNLIWVNNNFCCIVSNHDTNNTRTEIVKTLSNYKLITVAGGIKNSFIHKNIPIHILGAGKDGKDKQTYLNKFKFNICSESSITDGYITEKLVECIIGGCIPIYYCDDDNLIEPEIINNDFIIKYNNTNLESVLEKVTNIDSNINTFNQLISKKPLTENAYDNIIKYYDSLKDKILEKVNIYMS